MELSPALVGVFASAADTLLPRLEGEGRFWTSSASDLGVARRFRPLFEALPRGRDRADLRRLLRLLNSSAGGLLPYGKPKAFTGLSPSEREAALRRMATSRIGAARQGFQVLKRLTGFLAVTAPEGEASSPVWPDIGYPGPLGSPPDVPKPITPAAVSGPAEWTADAVVVESGGFERQSEPVAHWMHTV